MKNYKSTLYKHIYAYTHIRSWFASDMFPNHIEQSCGIGSMNTPTIIYEDKAACVTQMQTGYIKSNMTKHNAPKLFFPHELQQSRVINVMQTKSCDNLADLFTKSVPTSSFERIGMRRLRELQDLGGVLFKINSVHITLNSFLL